MSATIQVVIALSRFVEPPHLGSFETDDRNDDQNLDEYGKFFSRLYSENAVTFKEKAHEDAT